jgi:superfamily I DNA and/or RNA helicase
MLDTQYRMHPDIGELVSAMFYSGRLHHAADAARVGDIAARAPYPGRALVIVDTSGLTRCENRPGGYSRINSHSAAICERLVLAALADGITSIALITPYADQARDIRARLTRLGGTAAHVECNTVHRFQGHERDMVIFDAVDAAPLRPGILLSGQGPTSQATHLLNVTLSRARGKLLLVADLDYFRTLAPQSLMNRISAACIREMPPRA